MAGVSAVTARILRHNAGRAPDLLQRKYAAMAASPFAFFRATCHLFVDAWPARTALDGAPAVWGCGDLHLENFGSFKGDNRLVYFDINDFDEAALVPATWETTRMTTSVLVAAASLGVSSRTAGALARGYLDAYARALASGKPRWVERETAAGMTRELLDTVRGRTRRMLLDRVTRRKGARRSLVVDGKRALPVSRDDAALARRLVASLPREGAASFYRVIDVARRVSGLGSLGLSRWTVLVEGKGSPDGNYLLEVKEARPSVAARRSPCTQPRWESDAERVVQVQLRAQAVGPALLHPVSHGARSFVLRELQPSKDRLHLESWGGDLTKLRDAMATMGRITAWDALRAAGRQGSAPADDLIVFAGERPWRPGVLATAQRLASTMRASWRAFRADVAAGRT